MKNYHNVDRIVGNCVYEHAAIVSAENYTADQYAALLRGEEVAVAWNDSGEPIEWDVLSDDE